MFVARLLAALKMPLTHLGMLDDTLVLDVDLYRAALLSLVHKLSDEGAVDDAIAGWTFGCIADGWVDEHLTSVRDALLELGAVRDQAHLNRLLMAATHHILGCGPGTPAHGLWVGSDVDGAAGADGSLGAADALVLQTVTQALQGADSDHEPLGLRLLARRYALELGLLWREPAGVGGKAVRTPLGDAVLALPHRYVLTFLLALETLQSAGPADRWRTPRGALQAMSAQPQFLVATTAQARRMADAAGLFPWRRIRRLHLLGVCEPVRLQDEHGEPLPEDATRAAYPYRMSAAGTAAISGVLAEPRSELVELAEFLLRERAQAAVAPLLRRPPPLAPPTAYPSPLAPSAAYPPALALPAAYPPALALPAAYPPALAPPAAYPPALALPTAYPPPLRALQLPELDASDPLAAPRPWLSTDAAPAHPLAAPPRPWLPTDAAAAHALAERPARLPARFEDRGDELPWRVAGPLSTLPATAAALADPLLSDLPLGTGGEARLGAPLLTPASGSGAESARQEIDIGGLIQRAWAELQVTGVHFALLGPTVRTVGERRALLQAWRELLRCAADAALQGAHSPPLVTVELDPSAEAVQVLIHDSGPPLVPPAAIELAEADSVRREPEALPALADPARLHAVSGVRRGMWLAQHTLLGQGAQLALSTPQLGGTTVRVTLPRPVRSAA